MADQTVSAKGERAAMGGYVPQFNEFARFAYRELINGNLEWIRIADPEAAKLDDIQYATGKKVHAYQVKWTIADQTISYTNFIALLPSLVSSWQGLKTKHTSDGKKVIAHLLTNKALSDKDTIKANDIELGSFSDFHQEVWLNLKLGQPVGKKWEEVVKELIKTSELSDAEFFEFIAHFEFHHGHVRKEMKVSQSRSSTDVQDHLKFRDFLLEKVADPERKVPFSKQEIITGLVWDSRFKTTFNHELSVDRNRYQPISSTVNELDSKLAESSGGYLFLVGGPGTGKSTLLTEWIKNRMDRVIKYYAFDFTSPSSSVNYFKRGDATHLFFDLVLQLKEAGIYHVDVVPYQDLIFLKTVFRDQLQTLGDEFQLTGKKTIIVIDGLDHVPREYKSVAQSFLRELPLPAELPDGVYLVLGSQTYELEDLSPEIRAEWKTGSKSVAMNTLERKDVLNYIGSSNFEPVLTAEQSQLLYEKSQGHPLYLSYLVEKVRNDPDRDNALSEAIAIDGNIDLYYQKIWEPIKGDLKLVELLGMIARINGSINMKFIQEWGFDQKTQISFRKNARILFNESKSEWTFFHNSCRQFLLTETAKNGFTDEFDPALDKDHHKRLAELYASSEVEPHWKRNIHLFNAGDHEAFIAETTPDIFLEQMVNFRPTEEIKRDIKLGIEISQKTQDLPTLLRYLFCLAEINRRLFNSDPASYIMQYLKLGKLSIAKGYVRNGTTLLINEKLALKCARWFVESGDRTEGSLLFGLAEPVMVIREAIVVDYSLYVDRDTTDLLEEWVYSATMFEDFDIVLAKIKGLTAINLPEARQQMVSPEVLKTRLLTSFCFSLTHHGKWDELELALKEFNLSEKHETNSLFQVLKDAAEQSFFNGEATQAEDFLNRILGIYKMEDCTERKRIYIADLIMRIKPDPELAKKWIENISQPVIMNSEHMGHLGDFDIFRPLIKLNKVLNLTGQGVEITKAVPDANSGSDEQIIVRFQRMICLITQLYCEGVQGTPVVNLVKRIVPMAQFYNQTVARRNTYWYRLTQIKEDYFDFLIHAVAQFGQTQLEELAEYFAADFSTNKAYWTASEKRAVISSLIENEYDPEKARATLLDLEEHMLEGLDISGRITECISHADAMILLDEPEKAEHCIKQGIQESIGVGYRKDYQFNIWINWLDKHIQRHPKQAKDHILWFLSHLDHLKQTTEGRAAWLASDKILRSAFCWNFEAGIQQLKWQLDSCLVDFEDAVTSFIISYLQRTENEHDFQAVIPIYTEIFLPISVEEGTRLLRRIMEKGRQLSEENFYSICLPQLHQAIMTRSLEEHRPHLMAEIEDFVRTNQKIVTDVIPGFTVPEDYSHNKRTRSSNQLTIQPDYKTIDESEVDNQISNYQEFKELFSKEDQANSSFDWTKVIKKIIGDFTLDEIKEIAAIVGDRRKSIDVLTHLAERAAELGEQKLAEDLVNRAIAHSSTAGWAEFYDGGSRIKALNALKKLKGEEGTRKAFEIFGYDAMGSNAGEYAESLDEILPVIAPGYDPDVVWAELFDYLKRLMSTSSPIIDLPDLVPGDKPIHDSLVDFLRYLTGLEVTIINRPAQQLLAGHLVDKDSYTETLIADLPIATDAEAEFFTGIMLMAQAGGTDLSGYIQQIETLAVSTNFMLRVEAQLLLNKMGLALPVIEKSDLPAFYSLHLGSSSQTASAGISGIPVSGYDINDMIGPFDQHVKNLSRITSVNQKTLGYRVYSLMKSSGELDEWTPQFESKFKSQLEEIGLRYSYLKPRIVCARRATSRLVTELFDAGVIDLNQASRIFKGRVNPGEKVQLSARPNFIKRLGEPKMVSSSKDWTKDLSDNVRLKEGVFTTGEGSIVLGEYTLLRSLNWGRPIQVFMSQVKSKDVEEKPRFIFGSVLAMSAESYHQGNTFTDHILIVRDHCFSQQDVRATFLAFNPEVARYLGWLPQAGKMFAWMDENGNTMVESKYWVDGNTTMMPPHLYSESGEGWYVVASEEAFAQLKSAHANLYFEKFLSRESDDDYEQAATVIDHLD